MKTYREIVFMVMDSLKILSDDSSWEVEHIIDKVNRYRAMLFKQRYIDKKKEIPQAFYQKLNVRFNASLSNGAFKSIAKIPNLIDNGMVSTYSYLSPNVATGQKLAMVNQDKFTVVGFNKWTGMFVYVTIGVDGYMHQKSTALLNPQDIDYFTILDNPFDAYDFNGTSVSDILDIDFPCDETLTQAIMDLVVNELSKLMALPVDLQNNGKDDIEYQPKQ